MADGVVVVAPDSTGKKIDNSEITVGANTVERQRINIADPTSATAIATVTAANALKIDGSAVTQPVSGTFWQATQPVSGTFFQATQPVSVAAGAEVDGHSATIGTTTDLASVNTVIGRLKALIALLPAALVGGRLDVNVGAGAVTANIGTTNGLALDATVSGVAKDGAAITGQALEAGGTSISGWLSSIRKAITDRFGVLGQAAMVASAPVVIASNQSAVPVSGTFFQATQPVSGTVTDNQGTALPQTGAGWPVQPWGMADTLFAGAAVANPAVSAAIATLTTPAAGTYRINFSCFIYTANVVVGLPPDMELRKGAVVQFNALGGISGSLDGITVVGQTPTIQPFVDIRMTLDGATNVSINATVGAAAATYVAHLIATRIF